MSSNVATILSSSGKWKLNLEFEINQNLIHMYNGSKINLQPDRHQGFQMSSCAPLDMYGELKEQTEIYTRYHHKVMKSLQG